MALRFQRRLRILPGVRINLSKSGFSTSLGPRGADVNIGPHGVTTNAGIPGTGLSYRARLGTHASWLGVALLAAALAFWGGTHFSGTAPQPASVARTANGVAARPRSTRLRAPLTPGLVFVHRGGSDVRDAPKSSGRKLKKEAKGAKVTLISQSGGWAQVRDGDVTGYMRSSVLGAAPPASK